MASLDGLGALRSRRMFGGQYIYCDGLFFATVHDGKLYFKANAHTAAEFIAANRPVFSYASKSGLVKMKYYEAPPEVFDSREAMLRWARIALLAARQDSKAAKRIAASARRA